MAHPAPPFIGPNFDQICFAVEDLEEAAERWGRLAGITRWSFAYDLAKGQSAKEYWGEPEDFQFSAAHGYAGDVLIELIRPDGGRNVFRDWLDERGTGPHHIGFRLPTRGQYDEAHRHYEAIGCAKAMTGTFESGDGVALWSYFDTRAELGCFTEISFLGGVVLEQQEAFRLGYASSLVP